MITIEIDDGATVFSAYSKGLSEPLEVWKVLPQVSLVETSVVLVSSRNQERHTVPILGISDVPAWVAMHMASHLGADPSKGVENSKEAA
jgi:hypothetical protein